MTRLFVLLRWLAGYERPTVATHDDLEPYCAAEVLHGRFTAAPINIADHKAIHKIAARYGAEL